MLPLFLPFGLAFVLLEETIMLAVGSRHSPDSLERVDVCQISALNAHHHHHHSFCVAVFLVCLCVFLGLVFVCTVLPLFAFLFALRCLRLDFCLSF